MAGLGGGTQSAHFATLMVMSGPQASTSMPAAELAALPAPEQIARSADLVSEYMMYYPPRNSAQMYQAASMQQQNPYAFLEHLRVRTPHIARRPVLPKRSLNSWMAFRTFYKKIFEHLQQKEASIHLTALWKHEPFKAKWSIIAAAYSSIRNAVGTPQAPLDVFLKLVCPHMGIISIESYMQKLNWVCEAGHDGSMMLRQTAEPDFRAFAPTILLSSLTARDLVRFCGDKSYISQAEATYIAGAAAAQAGPTGMALGNQGPQHGLFASAPTSLASSQTSLRAPGNAAEATPPGPGPSVQSPPTCLNQEAQDYQWTGSMSDLYHPSEGSIDFDRLLKEMSPWNTTSIQQPDALNYLAENGGMQDGYLIPSVPDLDFYQFQSY